MKVLSIDKNNNFVLSQGRLVVAQGVEAVAVGVKGRVGFAKGENPYDTTQGTDYLNAYLGKMGGKDYIREEIRSRILNHPEVTGVNNITIEHIGDVLEVNTEVETIYGSISV